MHNTIDRLFDKTGNARDFASGYLAYLSQLLQKLDINSIGSFIEELESCRERGSTILIAGNGGSASTASHMINDLSMDILKKSHTEKPFRAFSLTDNTSLITAIANDDGYHNVFVNQLKIYYKPGDILIAISASGNSPNVVNAVTWVKDQGGRTIGVIGFDGGKLRHLCDLIVHVETPKGEFGPVEDIHLILNHLAALYLQCKLKMCHNETIGESYHGYKT